MMRWYRDRRAVCRSSCRAETTGSCDSRLRPLCAARLGLVFLSQQRVNAAHPIGPVTVDEVTRVKTQELGVYFVLLAFGSVQKSGHVPAESSSLSRPNSLSALQHWLGLIEFALVVKEFSQVCRPLELVRILSQSLFHLLLSLGRAANIKEHASVHPVNSRGGRVRLDAAAVSLFRRIVQSGIVVDVAELVPHPLRVGR